MLSKPVLFLEQCSRLLHSSVLASSTAKEILQQNNAKLFKVARAIRRSQTYDEDKIDEGRAMAEFTLTREHLRDLTKPVVPPTQRLTLYYLRDVYAKALQVHGSSTEIMTKRRPVLDITSSLSDTEKLRLRLILAAKNNTIDGADQVVLTALLCNICDTFFKFLASGLTGSKTMFSEGIHSGMDTMNQLILYFGIRFSARNPDPNFPYGYGNVRYITSLISGCGILGMGGGISICHGVNGLFNPVELQPLGYAFMALGLSFVFQGISLRRAYNEVKQKAKEAESPSMLAYIRMGGDPALSVVLLEDSAAVMGVLMASAAVSASALCHNPVFDSMGSIAIGCLLVGASGFIIRSNALHLVGMSMPKSMKDDVIDTLESDPAVKSVHDVKATSLGVEKMRFKAELDYDGEEITRIHLKKNCSLPTLMKDVRLLKDEAELEEFLVKFGGKCVDQVGDEVDRIERKIAKKHPEIRHVDLESM